MDSKMTCILASIFRGSWCIRAAKLGPRGLQHAPRRPNVVLRTAQKPPMRRPRRLKNRPRAA